MRVTKQRVPRSRDRERKIRSLLKRDGKNCSICRRLMSFKDDFANDDHMMVRIAKGVPPNDYATIDHVVPRGAGGRNKLENLRLACYKCNHVLGRTYNIASKEDDGTERLLKKLHAKAEKMRRDREQGR